MIVFRLSKAKYSQDLSGKGAERTGGRWNSKGNPMLYTSQSRALCLAEIAVHVPFGSIPKDYVMVSIEIPDHLPIEEIDIIDLEPGWNGFPHKHSTQIIGDDFIKLARTLLLKAPSAVVPRDFNYLINPLHEDFHKVKVVDIIPFDFDARLFGRKSDTSGE